MLAERERPSQSQLPGSIRHRRLPECQHSVERQAIDRLRHTSLLDLTSHCAQAQRFECDGNGRSQKSQVAKARTQPVVTHRQVLFDALLFDKPGYRSLLIAELIDQLEVYCLAARENPAIGNFFELRVIHASALFHESLEPGKGILDQRIERCTCLWTGRLETVGGRL